MFAKLARMFRAIVTLQDTPHSIALGTAIGLFIAWTPTVGIHMLLVIGLAMILRANKLAALIAVYVSNPITMVPMYWFEYWVGAQVLDARFTYAEMRALLNHHGWDGFKVVLWTLCVELAGPMWLGALVLALAHAVPGYYLTRWAVNRFQQRLQQNPTAVAEPTSGAESSDASPVVKGPDSAEASALSDLRQLRP